MSVLAAASGQSGSCFPARRRRRRQALQLLVLLSRSLQCQRKAPSVSVDHGWGNFLGSPEQRVTFLCYWTMIPGTAAQLLRGLWASQRMGQVKAGSWASPPLVSQPSSVARAAGQPAPVGAQPRRFPLQKPARGKTEVCPPPPQFGRAPTQRLYPRSPVPEKKVQRADPQYIEKNQYILFGKKLNISTQQFGQ